MRFLNAAAMLLPAALVLAACGKKETVQVQPQEPPPVTQPATPPAEPVKASDDDAARRAAEEARIRDALAAMVLFDYDRADVRADARPVLEEKARILRDQPGIRLRIEGHADERGSVEYNLALGLRRANAVREYLAGFGVDAGRLDVISYGEERPLAAGTSEADYARNRRAAFEITGGTITVR